MTATREELARIDGRAEPVYLGDRDFHLVHLNPACARRLALGAGAVEGRLCYEVMGHPEQVCARLCGVGRAGRLSMLERLVRHMRRSPRVSFARGIDVARASQRGEA